MSDTQEKQINDVINDDVEEVEHNEPENKEEKKPKKAKLPFGHYKVTVLKGSNENNKFLKQSEDVVVCKPLTQEQYADGWRSVLPKPKRGKQPIHHFSISLGLLPPHLWSKLHREYDDDGNDYYPIIKDNIYHYKITESEYDETLVALYHELYRGIHADRSKVKSYLDKLDNVKNSWLVIRARKFLKGTLDDCIEY